MSPTNYEPPADPNTLVSEIRTRLQEADETVNDNQVVFEVLAEMGYNLENEQFKGRTVADLFTTAQGIRINGELYPSDLPGLAEHRLNPDRFRAPARKVLSAHRQLGMIRKRVMAANTDFHKRVEREVRSVVRKIKQGKARVRRFRQGSDLKSLSIFASGVPLNHLADAERGSIVHVGVLLPPYPVTRTFRTNAKPERILRNIAQEYSSNLLDHTQSVVMAAGAVTGHDRVIRELVLHVYANIEGITYSVAASQRKMGRLRFDEVKEASGPDRVLAKGEVQILGHLDYSFRCSNARIGELLDVLGYLENLPLFRSLMISDAQEDAPIGQTIDDLLEDEEEASPVAPVAQDAPESKTLGSEATPEAAEPPAPSEAATAAVVIATSTLEQLKSFSDEGLIETDLSEPDDEDVFEFEF